MKGGEKYLVSMFKTAEKMIIPVYQRNYEWKTVHCERLFDDLIETAEKDRQTHFFGGIVSVNDPKGRWADRLIIDGQQRITTVNLLLLALANLLKEGKIVPDDPTLADTIVKKYLADEIDPNKRKIKLKPIKGDADAFEKLWKSPDDFDQSSNVTQNYTYFYNRIQKGELTADQLFGAIERLQIIDIELTTPDDDPQLVFESLNSTGLALSEGDKIRNYILMDQPVEVQERYYEDYWNPIEIRAGHDKRNNSYDVSRFIRDFLSIKQGKIPNINSIYFAFKEYAGSSDAEHLLQDMLRYARRYEKLLNGNPEIPMLNDSIIRLNRFESSVTRPFLMEVLRLLDEDSITAENAAEAFSIVESYLLRRAICDLPSNSLNKVFLSLYNDILRLDSTLDDFADKMKYVLSMKKEKARFPDDHEFSEGLRNKNVYKMNPGNKAYIFERLENDRSKESIPIYDHIDSGNFTVEHIMPQTLTAEWKVMLGPDFENIHETWLHRLANLTLTAYNPEYQNYGFEKKRTMKDGYSDSGLRMNQRIARNTKWGLDELEERFEHLTEKACSIWLYVETDYAPPEKQYEEYVLDDEVNLIGRKIVRFDFNGIRREVKSWKEMYSAVVGIMHENNKNILNYLADADDSIDLAIHVTRTEEFEFTKIDENLYLWTHSNTQYKKNLLQKFFALYGEDPGNLTFAVK